MKVAIVHDSFLHLGGAERVLLEFSKLFPQADIYIPLIKNSYLSKLKKRHHVFTSKYNFWPFKETISSYLKPFIFNHWENLDLSDYDLVISSSHSFSSKSVKTQLPTKHLSYIHTPPRYLYQNFNETRWISQPFIRQLLSPILNYLRKKDLVGSRGPDVIIASSQTVQERIKKYYGRQSQVIYPPIKTPPKKIRSQLPKKYYLCVSRLVKQKGIDLAIQACNQLKYPLLVVGEGKQARQLKKIAGLTVKFLGFVPDSELDAIYAQAKALIFPAIEEDFGLVPVEAMSHGTPVITYQSGGVKETVIAGKTGLFFSKYNVTSLIRAIKKFEKMSLRSQDCIQHSQQFSVTNFQKNIKQAIGALLKT